MSLLPSPRVYCDTSVIGGCFDTEFEQASLRFFELVDAGLFKLVLSFMVDEEMTQAPSRVQAQYAKLAERAEIVQSSAAAVALLQAYLDHQILAVRWEVDALHVALASIARCDMIVSWNFAHIVQYDKIRKYNAVNVLCGYNPLAIHSPLEVIGRERD